MEESVAVRVKFMGDLKGLLRQKDLTINLPQGSSIGDLLSSLSKSYGEPFTSRVFNGPQELHHYILIFLNGQDIREVGGLEARLGESDVEILMLPMFEGG